MIKLIFDVLTIKRSLHIVIKNYKKINRKVNFFFFIDAFFMRVCFSNGRLHAGYLIAYLFHLVPPRTTLELSKKYLF